MKGKAPVFAFGYAVARKGAEAEGRRKRHQKMNIEPSNVQHRILNENEFYAVNRELMNLEPEATCGASACALRATS